MLRRLQQQQTKAALDMSAAGKNISAEDSYGGRDVYDTV